MPRARVRRRLRDLFLQVNVAGRVLQIRLEPGPKGPGLRVDIDPLRAAPQHSRADGACYDRRTYALEALAVPSLKRSSRDWNALGERRPLGAILTSPGGGMPEWDVDRFFATGRADVERFLRDLDDIAPRTARHRVLDFGCGVGRVTRALADRFDAAVGVDVAASMIRRARALNRGIANCRFVVNRGAHLRRFTSGSFDVAYSRLVLQHIPPIGLRTYIPELIRVLADSGVLMFQLPEEIDVEPVEAFLSAPVTGNAVKRHAPRAVVRAYRRLKYRVIAGRRVARMEMYGMARDSVISLVTAAGGRLLDVRPDDSHGSAVAGFEYWVMRAR